MTESDQSELRACPFCGDRDEFNPSISPSYSYKEPGDPEKGTIGNPAAGLEQSGCYVECDKCGACGANKPTKKGAIAAWNRRALSAAPVADESLRKALTDTTQMLDGFLDEAWMPDAEKAALAVQIETNRASLSKGGSR